MTIEWLSVFLTGLLVGAPHCAGMCGGIVSILSMQATAKQPYKHLILLISYNVGRIASYMLAGFVVGVLGALFSQAGVWLYQAFATLSALLIIALGLYISNTWHGVRRLEVLGKYIWAYLEPISRRFIPVRHAGYALIVGGVWGWLPCGLVYSILVTASTSGGGVEGALIMLAFGLGTFPVLLAYGWLAKELHALINNLWLRRLAGFIIILLGLYQLGRIWLV